MLEKLFARKIENGETNPLTGEVWKIEDVPERYREEVESLLEENKDDE